jgi:predicted nucleotidyltransferase
MTVAAGHHLDPQTERFVADVLAAIDEHVPIVEAFLLGSGAAGGFDPETSDVDVTVVVARPLGAERADLVEAVARLEVPVRSLELVLYVEGAQPPDYELNLNEGEERDFEQPFWFVLDAAKAQEQAVPLWGRRSWGDFFVPVSAERTREAVRESLDWALRQTPDDEFARGHVLRARHYLEHGEWITKKEAQA